MSSSYSSPASNSQVTLLNPGESTTFLALVEKTVLNSTLLFNGNPYISVTTVDSAASSTTTITDDSAGRLLVTIRRRKLSTDDITFSQHYNGETLKLKSWLVKSKMTNGYPKWTVQTPSENFVWRNDAALRWTLCPEDDLDHPIAWLQQAVANDPYGLVFKRGTEQFWDQIIAAFIILEHKLRVLEIRYRSTRS